MTVGFTSVPSDVRMNGFLSDDSGNAEIVMTKRWCVWREGNRYLMGETSLWRKFPARKPDLWPLVRDELTNAQASVLHRALNGNESIYCKYLLPEVGQRVRFWVASHDTRDQPTATRALSGVFDRNHFYLTLSGVQHVFGLDDTLGSWAYAWEPEPQAPPLPAEERPEKTSL